MEQTDRHRWQGRALIVGAAVLWSTSGFFAKAPWYDNWPLESRGLLLAFWRGFFALLTLLPLIRKPTWHWAMVPMAFSFAAMVWTFLTAVVSGPAANAIWLQYLCPAWVFLASLLFFKERASPADVRMVLCCLSGVVLIIAMELRSGGNLYATGMAVLSGIFFAGVIMSMRRMPKIDPTWLITLNHLATVVMLCPFVVAAPATAVPLGSYIALALFGIVQISVPYIMFGRGLRSTTPTEASLLTLIEPVILPLWVFIAWRNHPTYQPPQWWTYCGGALILAGLLSRYVPPLRQELRIRNGKRSSKT